MSKDDHIVLVVDDERAHADGIVEALEKSCAKAIAVYTGRDALDIVSTQPVDIIITDLRLEDDIDGLTILDEALKQDANARVILMTAYATIETCKEAIKRGASEYLVKPIDIDELRTLVEQLCRETTAPRTRKAERPTTNEGFTFEGVMGHSPAMQGIFHVLQRVAPTNISVLIEGESGTGKELLARSIHDNSKRQSMPFRPINCAGLSESLLESELFGHVKGAFTGAATDRKGLFEIADRGTLFLDEIGDMPTNMQAKLLRVLEDGVIIPVGSSKPVVVDVRIISATNQNLSDLIAQQKFREDLYFRIKGVNVTLSALRDRSEDIPELVRHFLAEAAKETGAEVTGISDAAMNILVGYDWPGNIRQLRNSIRTMVVMCDRPEIDVQDMPPEIHQVRQLGAGVASPDHLAGFSLNEIEKQAIVQTLAKTEGNREQAAKILGIGERTLYRKIKEYNL